MERVLSNPLVSSLPAPQKAEQAELFLTQNAQKLAPVLSGPGFFPGYDWGSVVASFRSIIGAMLLPELRSRIDEMLSAEAVKAELSGPGTEFKERFGPELIAGEARSMIAGELAAAQYRLAERYIEEIAARRGYIHVELTKVQRLKYSYERLKPILSLGLLCRSLALWNAYGAAGVPRGSAPIVAQLTAENVEKALKASLPSLPALAVESGARSLLSFQDNPSLDASARLVSIFAGRGRSYRHGQVAERGAEGPDKSWFNVARRNAAFFGYDSKMLDELYMIAADRGW
jgi:hypothetical protein